MEYTSIDNVKISKIALGCADLGTKISKDQSFKLIDLYRKNGGNLLDTGRVYCSWIENGTNKSETTIGQYIKSRNCRNEIIIATKGGHPDINNFSVSRINEKEITKDLNESLFYLGVDYIDIYYLHRDDETKPVSEIMTFLDKFVKEGKIKYLGASNWKFKRILEANQYAKEHGLTPFSFSEIMWSFARPNKDGIPDKTLVWMDENEYNGYINSNIKVMAFSSQAQGFYSNVDKNGIDSLDKYTKTKFINDINSKRYDLLKSIQNSKCSLTSLGLNPLIKNKKIDTIPIIGASSEELLIDSLNYNSLKDNQILKLLSFFDF